MLLKSACRHAMSQRNLESVTQYMLHKAIKFICCSHIMIANKYSDVK